MDFPVYKMTIDELTEGVQYVSLVDLPAIEKPFQAFDNKVLQRFRETSEQRVLSGPLMLADVPIYREDATYGQYYVVFDKDTIRKIVQKYFKQGNQHNVNAFHNTELDGVYMFESYIIDKSRGINPPIGYEDVTDGSWFGSFKVENEQVWENRKAFTGFSVEGLFGMKPTTTELELSFNALIEDLTYFLQHLNKTNNYNK
jgi:hypothetical protein